MNFPRGLQKTKQNKADRERQRAGERGAKQEKELKSKACGLVAQQAAAAAAQPHNRLPYRLTSCFPSLLPRFPTHTHTHIHTFRTHSLTLSLSRFTLRSSTSEYAKPAAAAQKSKVNIASLAYCRRRLVRTLPPSLPYQALALPTLTNAVIRARSCLAHEVAVVARSHVRSCCLARFLLTARF